MRRRWWLVWALCLATSASSVAAPVMERVRFASFDLDRDGAPQMLDALLFRPAGEQNKPLPAVVALHGCGGMYSIVTSRKDALSIRHRMMAELLTSEGYAVLFPDSFRSRGREEICSQTHAERTVTQAHRRLDALAALAYLQARSDIAPERIAALGWSHGGSTVLEAINASASLVQHYRDEEPAVPFFRAAVAFYPGCLASLRGKEGYAPAAPLLVLAGASDDWTSPRPCVMLVERLQRASAPADIVVYPDTFHGFDGPNSQPRMHLDLPNGVRPGQGVTLAVNPAARQDAYVRVRAFLRSALQRP